MEEEEQTWQEKDYPKVTVSVPPEMKMWLNRNPGLNKSLAFRDKINELRGQTSLQKDFTKLKFQVAILVCCSILLFILLPRNLLGFLLMFYLASIVWILIVVMMLYVRLNEVNSKWKTLPRKGNEKKQEPQ